MTTDPVVIYQDALLPPSTLPSQSPLLVTLPETWIIHTNGSCNKLEAGIGFLLASLDDSKVQKVVYLCFNISNNKEEYEVTICALETIRKFDITRIRLFTNSSLITYLLGGFH